VRESPSPRSIEKWVLPSGQATVVLRNATPVTTDDDTWWFISANAKTGWVRESDVRMTAVNITASELADVIYNTVSDDHPLLK
jgi:hypothetical protein